MAVIEGMDGGYKLTDAEGYTRRGREGETRWSPPGTRVAALGEYAGPCGQGCLHFYGSPEEAVLYDPIHANYGPDARLWRVAFLYAPGIGPPRTDGLKWWLAGRPGVPLLETIEEVALPVIPTELRVAWAICLAPHASTRGWAVRWLSDADRTEAAAEAAARAAAEAEAAWAAAAAWAAWAAAWAEAAAWAAEAVFPARSLRALRRAEAILAGTRAPETYGKDT